MRDGDGSTVTGEHSHRVFARNGLVLSVARSVLRQLGMRIRNFLLFGALCLSLLTASGVDAQATPALAAPDTATANAAPERADTEPDPGSMLAEIGGAVLGDALGIVVSGALVLPTIGCIACDDEDSDDEGKQLAALGAGWALRPVIVGGLTAALARPSRGEGRAYAAMVGAIPGTLIIGTSWLAGSNEISLPGVVLGHVLTIGGAVTGYRLSAHFHRHFREPRVTPSAFATPHTLGLSVQGRF